MILFASHLREAESTDPGSLDDQHQRQADELVFDSVYDAEDFAEQLQYSFVATLRNGQKWRVFPGERSPQLVQR